ncbi:MAG: hypothetical protein WBA23_21660 [Tunicatimonas sp.]|uniref:hypothetical protein n=1 Tax=Tunicatimonas sp. TaxID=1940096 RepID=UPI003C75C4B7
MKLEELQQAWQQYDQKLDKYLQLNQKILKEVNLQKIRPLLRTLVLNQVIGGTIFFSIIVVLGGFIVVHIQQVPLLVSAFILLVFAVIGWIGNINQWSTISQISYDEPITEMQQKLQKFRADSIQYMRLLMLSVPFYLTYIILGFHVFGDIDIYSQADQKWWYAQVTFSLLLVPVAIWLYQKLNYRNMHIPWVRSFVESAGGKSVEKAMILLGELDEFNQEKDH